MIGEGNCVNISCNIKDDTAALSQADGKRAETHAADSVFMNYFGIFLFPVRNEKLAHTCLFFWFNKTLIYINEMITLHPCEKRSLQDLV